MGGYNKLAYFNVLKFIAAICIAVFLHWNDHLLPYLKLENNTTGLLRTITIDSYVFVELFFIISGILFVISYEKKIYDESIDFNHFIINRFKRICPLVIITTIIQFILNWVCYESTGAYWSCGSNNMVDLILDILFSSTSLLEFRNTNNGPTWYVSVLFVMYILAFILVKLSKRYKTKLIYFIPLFIGIISFYNDRFMYTIVSARGLVAFFVGVLLAHSFQYIDCYINQSFKNRIIYRIILGLLLMMMLYSYKNNCFDNIFLLFSIGVFPTLVLFLYDFKVVNTLCDTTICKFLGNISFGIYVWNFPILLIIHILITTGCMNINVLNPVFFFILFVIHIAVAIGSYYFIENRFLKNII